MSAAVPRGRRPARCRPVSPCITNPCDSSRGHGSLGLRFRAVGRSAAASQSPRARSSSGVSYTSVVVTRPRLAGKPARCPSAVPLPPPVPVQVPAPIRFGRLIFASHWATFVGAETELGRPRTPRRRPRGAAVRARQRGGPGRLPGGPSGRLVRRRAARGTGACRTIHGGIFSRVPRCGVRSAGSRPTLTPAGPAAACSSRVVQHVAEWDAAAASPACPSPHRPGSPGSPGSRTRRSTSSRLLADAGIAQLSSGRRARARSPGLGRGHPYFSCKAGRS